MADKMTIAEYARHRKEKGLPGSAYATVQAAARAGRIEMKDGKIDPDEADRMWEERTRKKSDIHISTPPTAHPSEGENEGRESAPASVTYADVKIRESKAKAEKLEMENAVRKGELVDRSGVERAAFQFGRILQKSLVDVLPSKISMELASMTDPWIIECFVRDQLRQELNSISDMQEDDVASA